MLRDLKPGGFDRTGGWGVAVATALSALAAFAADPASRTPPNNMLLAAFLGGTIFVVLDLDCGDIRLRSARGWRE